MRDMSFGQYYPTASPIHKLDARVKILLSVLYIVFIFFVPSYVGYFVTFLFITAVFIIGKIPMRAMLKSVKGILFLLIFMAVLNVLFYKEGKVLVDWWIIRITDKGIDFAIKMALRLAPFAVKTHKDTGARLCARDEHYLAIHPDAYGRDR